MSEGKESINYKIAAAFLGRKAADDRWGDGGVRKEEASGVITATDMDDFARQKAEIARENAERTKAKEQIQYIDKEAREILGSENVLGPLEVQKAFGIELEEVAEIPFSKQELENARECGMQLVYQIDKLSNGEDLTIWKMAELVEERMEREGKGILLYRDHAFKDRNKIPEEETTPTEGWRLVTRELVEGSKDKNYVEQTDLLIRYAKEEMFKGMELPQIYKEAIAEYEQKKDGIIALMETGDEASKKQAAQELSQLQITQLVRPSVGDEVYRVAVELYINDTRLLEGWNYSWTKTLSVSGWLVFVGFFNANGLNGDSFTPDDRDDTMGCSFSRSV